MLFQNRNSDELTERQTATKMNKQLVFYVNKIMRRNGDVFIRILPNIEKSKAIWIEWNNHMHIPKFLEDMTSLAFEKNQEKEKNLCGLVHDLFESFNEYEQFKILFNKEEFTIGTNPYFKKSTTIKYVDIHLSLHPKEIRFINDRLFLQVVDEA